ncbi:MAG: hypothetical protein [Caudoviricetes sp.]|nr:MAG: hypothetical protein [Caudoviricetes sp.]
MDITELLQHYDTSINGYKRSIEEYKNLLKNNNECFMKVDYGIIGLALFLEHKEDLEKFMKMSQGASKALKEAAELLKMLKGE